MKILVVAAHPDDEILGCGGTIAKHIAEKHEVYILILSKGVSSRFSEESKKEQIEKKELFEQAKKAAKELGIHNENLIFGSFPDNKFDSVPLLNIVKFIETNLEEINPDIIYTHYKNDLNIDHRRTYMATITATRPFTKYNVKKILSFEVLSSTECAFGMSTFSPNVYVDIEKYIDKKINAFRHYKNEIREYPHPRSIEGIEILARRRGLESGLKFAEAFKVVRIIDSKKR